MLRLIYKTPITTPITIKIQAVESAGAVAALRDQRGKIVLCRRWTAVELRMTLAGIVVVNILCLAAPLAAAQTQQTQEAAPAAQTPSPPSSAAPAKTSSGQPAPATSKQRHKKNKKIIPANCNSTSGAAAGSGPASTAPSQAPATGNAANGGGSSAATNCPPPKTIVRQGGTSDPSIELAGAAGTQTSNQRDAANQMWGSTEENLKKIAGRQLSSEEQDLVSQIRQFMQQSKAAAADGDLDRARTLAWKAQVLSEELVKPPK
jgi:hypothetical protein